MAFCTLHPPMVGRSPLSQTVAPLLLFLCCLCWIVSANSDTTTFSVPPPTSSSSSNLSLPPSANLLYNLSLTAPTAVPRVSSVSGCAFDAGNASFGCVAGRYNLTIAGANFEPYALVVVGYTNILPWFVDPTTLLVPAPAPSNLAGGPQEVYVYSGGARSSSQYLVTYDSTLAQVVRVTGCPIAVELGTADCTPGTVLSVYGFRFPYQLTIAIYGSWPCGQVYLYNSSFLTCVLPAVDRQWQGMRLTIQLTDSNTRYYTTSDPLVSYTLAGPHIFSISGCSVALPSTNSTADCLPGSVVTIAGSNFTASTGPADQLAVYVQTSWYQCNNLTALSSTLLTCSLPLFNALGGTFSLVVSSMGLASNPFPLTYVSLQPVILGLVGCNGFDSQANLTSGCVAGERLTVQGAHFFDVNSVWVNIQNEVCTNITVYSSSELSCQLPQLPSTLWGQSMWVGVKSSGQVSSSYVRLSYANIGPYILSVSGCAQTVGNTTRDCNGADLVTITGRNFSSDNITVSTSYPPQYLTNVTRLSRFVITANLPFVAVGSQWGSPQLLPILVTVDGVYSNSPPLVAFTSQVPVISSVTGCAYDNSTDGSTRSCKAGSRITVNGVHFYNVSLYAAVSNSACTDVVWVSSKQLTCVLPPYSSPYGDQPQTVIVSSNGLLPSSYSPLVWYWWDSAFIEQVRGCSIAGPGNSTTGCNGGDTITVTGRNFTNSSTTQILLDVVYRYQCPQTVWLSSTELSCVLPQITTATGQNYTLSVLSEGVYSNQPVYVGYGPQLPTVVNVTGCAVNHTDGSTSGCAPWSTLTISGMLFQSVTSVTVGGVACSSLAFLNPNKLTCQLPMVPVSSLGQTLPVVLFAGSSISEPAYLVTYAHVDPVVWSVKGCSMDSLCNNGTGGCSGGDRVTVIGLRFNVTGLMTASVWDGVGTNYDCFDVVMQSSSVFSCRLPYMRTTGQTYQFQVGAPNYGFITPPYVTYVSQLPLVNRAWGCDRSVGNSTFGCLSGQNLTVQGSQFLNVQRIWIGDTGRSWTCENITLVNSMLLTCTLPSIGEVYYQGRPLYISLYQMGMPTGQDYLLSYAVVGPVVYSAKGCTTDAPRNGTAGCTNGTTVYVTGERFPTDSQIAIAGRHCVQHRVVQCDAVVVRAAVVAVPALAGLFVLGVGQLVLTRLVQWCWTARVLCILWPVDREHLRLSCPAH